MRTAKMVFSLLIIILVFLAPIACRRDGQSAGTGMASLVQSVDIPYEEFVLDNGLTVIIHEDHKAPIVAVHISYRVGSGNEKPGKTGLAHLFEHVMYKGSENFKGDHKSFLEKAGATDFNGHTDMDRTYYFQTVPVSSLDMLLWLESDRMGHLMGAVARETLDEVRSSLRNERDYRRSEEFYESAELIAKACFPKDHPYSWTTSGSEEDLASVTLEDVKEWYKTYYGAANAVVVLAGDIAADEALAKVKRYFGDIPAGPPLPRHADWVAKRTGSRRQTVQVKGRKGRVIRVWNVPGWGTESANRLFLAANILGSESGSRLGNRLIDEEGLAAEVQARVVDRGSAGLFMIEATTQPGIDFGRLVRIMGEELERFLKEGPTAAELERVKASHLAWHVRQLEQVGGEMGKSDILAASMVLGGSPDAYRMNLDMIEKATPRNVQETCRKWLSDGDYVLEFRPYPEYKTAVSDLDRSRPPESGRQPDARFPKLERATLSNGLKVVLARHDPVPVILFNMLLDAGSAADPPGRAGLASLALDMLDQGTRSRPQKRFEEELNRLGTVFGAGSMLDFCTIPMSTLRRNIDASLSLYADAILNPAFPELEFAQLKFQAWLKSTWEMRLPISIAWHYLPRMLYEEGHAYRNPLTGSGTESSVTAITRDDVRAFHRTWVKPNNATLVVVGAVSMDELKPKLERCFSGWKAGQVPRKNIGRAAGRSVPGIYLLDDPKAKNTIVLGGFLTLPRANPDEVAVEMMDSILGDRLMGTIRAESPGDFYSPYGFGCKIGAARGQRLYVFFGAVEPEKTKESILRIAEEIRDIAGTRPPTAEELEVKKDGRVRSLPGQWETALEIGRSIGDMVVYGFPEDYFSTYAAKIKGLTTDDLARAAKAALGPAEGMVWVVVGDGAKVAPALKELGFGEVKRIDKEGKPIK